MGLCPCCARATHVLAPPVYSVGRPDRKKQNSISLWQSYGPYATRSYSAAMYYNANGILPDTWDWLASRHLLQLPPPLNPEDGSRLEDGASREELGEPSGSTLGRPSVLSAVASFPQNKKIPKPPPPIHPSVASASPSPAQSRGAFKGSPSRGSSSWEGEWNPSRTQSWDWQSRRWPQ